MKILILHRMGDPDFYRESVRSLEYMVPECRPDLRFIIHDADLPFPNYLKSIEYELIILGPTFLCSRYNSKIFKHILNNYNFIKYSNSCKIALPQDDYDCAGILDNWMMDWKISRIYTICPEYWDILYPLSSKCIDIKLGYTGYISNSWIDNWKTPKKQLDRKIDISYRASKLPANFGKLGQLKSEIATTFKEAFGDPGHLIFDISTDYKDIISGTYWHKFIENSKFCLVTPSGSSILDINNNIRQSVETFTNIYPNASFSEIEKNCFSGLDGKFEFSMVSPRNIEAALAKTIQIAVKGNYSGLMKPFEHYIPLDRDCSNILEVKKMITDKDFTSNIANKCKDIFLSEPRLRQENFVKEMIDFAKEFINQNNLKNSNKNTEVLFKKYNENINQISKLHWNKNRLLIKAKKIGVRLGLKKIINKFF